MTLKEAARLLGIAPATLRRYISDSRRPARLRRYPATLHEHYLTRHFVKDTKGRRTVTKGPYPWLIDERHVHQAVTARRSRLSGGSTHRATDDMYARLARVL